MKGLKGKRDSTTSTTKAPFGIIVTYKKPLLTEKRTFKLSKGELLKL